MASTKFEKDSIEFKMFGDYWKLCQSVWIVEDNGEYWDSLLKSTNEFVEKYRSVPLSARLANALLDELDGRDGNKDSKLKRLLREVMKEIS